MTFPQVGEGHQRMSLLEAMKELHISCLYRSMTFSSSTSSMTTESLTGTSHPNEGHSEHWETPVANLLMPWRAYGCNLLLMEVCSVYTYLHTVFDVLNSSASIRHRNRVHRPCEWYSQQIRSRYHISQGSPASSCESPHSFRAQPWHLSPLQQLCPGLCPWICSHWSHYRLSHIF